MSHFDSAITPVAGVGANIRSRRQSGCLGGAQAQLVTAEIILTLNELLLNVQCSMNAIFPTGVKSLFRCPLVKIINVKIEEPSARCKDESENSMEDVACVKLDPSNVFMMVVMCGDWGWSRVGANAPLACLPSSQPNVFH